VSDQPGSGQDPQQQPPNQNPSPPTPPPGFTSGDPLGGSGGGAPSPPPQPHGDPVGPGPSQPPGGGQQWAPPPSAPPAPAGPPAEGGWGAPAPSPSPGGWGSEADKGHGASGGLPPGLQGSSSFGTGLAGHHGNLAGWGSRALAVIIDGLILAIPIVIAMSILTALFVSDDDGSSSGLFGGGFIVTLLASFLIQLAYYPLMMSRKGDKNGQTIGKQVMNIRAVRLDKQPLELSHAMMREIVGKVIPGSVCGLYTLVDYLWPLGDKQNQALHDKIGSTVVVSTK
jgi:uncharacterized RDD family membrane protein YckC